VYFQPKKSPDGKLRGMEALVRWRRNGVIQNTQKFVDTVERLGRSEALFIIVMSRVVKHMRQWITHKKELVPVSINIAPSQLSRVQTLPIIQSNIEKYAIAPHLLEFEITEGEFIQHYADAQLLLSQLQELGCAVSCDDFGVGYSDLKELANLSFNTIKFDRSWLKAIENSPKRIKLIEGLITIIHQQGSAVLFEGVETVQELNLLKQLAVDYIQGFHFSKPLPAEEMESQLPGLVPNWSVSGSSAQQYGKKQKTKNTDNCRAGG
jgi:EAL domain-containing protein (putative c-di-GMP-specific phosphodiesterase class I)